MNITVVNLGIYPEKKKGLIFGNWTMLNLITNK